MADRPSDKEDRRQFYFWTSGRSKVDNVPLFHQLQPVRAGKLRVAYGLALGSPTVIIQKEFLEIPHFSYKTSAEL